jgi:tripartite-type tricarboxylate transporter receptor subunit TctC
MGKYIPGNPTIIVDNMPGAGHMVAANHIYRVAKPDGLTIAHFTGYLVWNQIFKKPGVEFDIRKFEWLGAPVKEDSVIALHKSSGITSMEKWMNAKTPVKFGGFIPGSGSFDIVPLVLKETLGLPVKVVFGYKGAAEIRLAAESGEVAGAAFLWDSVKATWTKAIDSGDVAIVLQNVPKPFPDLPNVPLAINFAKTDEARLLIDVAVHKPTVFSRPLLMPPGTPKDRVQILRDAFQETLRDKELLAEAAKSRLGIDPVTDKEVQESIDSVFKLDPALLTKLDNIFYKSQ